MDVRNVHLFSYGRLGVDVSVLRLKGVTVKVSQHAGISRWLCQVNSHHSLAFKGLYFRKTLKAPKNAFELQL